MTAPGGSICPLPAGREQGAGTLCFGHRGQVTFSPIVCGVCFGGPERALHLQGSGGPCSKAFRLPFTGWWELAGACPQAAITKSQTWWLRTTDTPPFTGLEAPSQNQGAGRASLPPTCLLQLVVVAGSPWCRTACRCTVPVSALSPHGLLPLGVLCPHFPLRRTAVVGFRPSLTS